jgi:hypothetical protein
LGNIKGSYLSSASTMEKLGIFPSNVPIPSKCIVIMMEILITTNNLRRTKLETRRNSTRKIKNFTPNKTVIHLT